MRKTWAAGLALSLAFAGFASAQDISVGVAGPMTGPEASFGTQLKNGAEAALADINAAGGVMGRKLKLEVGDDACDPKQARAVGEKFASQKLPFVAGHYCSSSSIPASEAYAEGNVLQITPASTNPVFTERKLWNTFRVCGRDDQQGRVGADYIAEKFPGRAVAVIHDKSAYGKGLADFAKARLNDKGVTEVMYEAITQGDKDFGALISKMKAARVDVIYFGGYHTEAGLMVRQAREQGLTAALVSGDALVTQEFWSITGPAGEGTFMTFDADPRKNPIAAPLVAKFRAQGYDPEGYTLYTYAAVQVYAQAVTRARSTKLKDVLKVMQTATFDTVLGLISFNAKGDEIGRAHV